MNTVQLFLTYMSIITIIVILLVVFSKEHRETFASPAANSPLSTCPPSLSQINNDSLSLTYSTDVTQNNSKLTYCANRYVLKCNGTNTKTIGPVVTKTNTMQLTNTNNQNVDTNTVYFSVTGENNVVQSSTLTALPT